MQGKDPPRPPVHYSPAIGQKVDLFKRKDITNLNTTNSLVMHKTKISSSVVQMLGTGTYNKVKLHTSNQNAHLSKRALREHAKKMSKRIIE